MMLFSFVVGNEPEIKLTESIHATAQPRTFF